MTDTAPLEVDDTPPAPWIEDLEPAVKVVVRWRTETDQTQDEITATFAGFLERLVVNGLREHFEVENPAVQVIFETRGGAVRFQDGHGSIVSTGTVFARVNDAGPEVDQALAAGKDLADG